MGDNMALATRLENLGTETAFAVSLAAAEWGAKRNRIFPFHLGDLNLPTSQNIVDAMNKAIVDGKTGYCPGAGLDVFEFEPKVHEGLLNLENVVLIPHLGSATVDTRAAMADIAATNALAILANQSTPNLVTS